MMAAGLLQRAAAPLPRHFPRMLWATLALTGYLVPIAAAQTDTTASPEQPNWASPSNPGASNSGTSTSSAPMTGTGVPASPSNSGVSNSADGTQSSAAPAPLTVTQAGASQAWQRNTSSSGYSSSVGVPDISNYNLPNFRQSSYGQAWFERSGLKFRFGPVNFRMTLGLGAEYSDNIFASNIDPVGDSITTVAPQFLLGMGDFQTGADDFLSLYYAPQLAYYTHYSSQNRTNQSLDFKAHKTLSRYSTTVDLNYLNTNQVNATQTGLSAYQILTFNWNNSYYVGAKTSAQFLVNALSQTYNNGGTSYLTLGLTPQLGYDLSPKTTFTFGPSFGTSYVGSGSSQTFEELNAGIQWTNLRKLTVNAQLGYQVRQFHGLNSSGASNFSTPVYNVTVTYQPRLTTSLSMALSRDVELSDLVQGQTYTSTAASISIGETVLDHVALGLGLSYQDVQYQGGLSDRTDKYIAFTPTVTYSFLRDTCSASLFYQRLQRTSTIQSYGYAQDNYGLQLTYHF